MKPNQIALARAMPKLIGRSNPQKAVRPKVAWCIPLEESVYAAWFTNYIKMASAADDKIITTEGSFIDTARNNLVELFLRTDAEYLFFLDSDTCPPVDAVERLLAVARGDQAEGRPQVPNVVGAVGGRWGQGVPLQDRPIVSGWYNVKKRPHHPCVFDYVGWNAEKQWHDYHARENAPEDPGAELCAIGCGKRHAQVIEQVDAIGFGCILLRRDVFTTIDARGGWFTTSEGGTEDMSFCRRAAKASVPVFVDWSLHCAHIGLVKI